MFFSSGFAELVFKNFSSTRGKIPSFYYQSESFNLTALNLAFKELSRLNLDSSNATDTNILKVCRLNFFSNFINLKQNKITKIVNFYK
jgi:hypothetical protein